MHDAGIRVHLTPNPVITRSTMNQPKPGADAEARLEIESIVMLSTVPARLPMRSESLPNKNGPDQHAKENGGCQQALFNRSQCSFPGHGWNGIVYEEGLHSIGGPAKATDDQELALKTPISDTMKGLFKRIFAHCSTRMERIEPRIIAPGFR